MFLGHSLPLLNVKLFLDTILLGEFDVKEKERWSKMLWSFQAISCPSYRSSSSIPTRWSFLVLEVLLSLFSLLVHFSLLTNLLREKEEKVKEILKIVGLRPWLNSLAWASTSLFSQLLFIVSLTVLWKISLAGWIVFLSVPCWLLIFSLFICQIHLLSFTVLLGQVFSSFSRSFVFSLLCWLSSLFLFFSSLPGESLLLDLFVCLSPFSSLFNVLRLLFLSERAQFVPSLSLPLYSSFPSLSQLFVRQLFVILLFWTLTWYIEKIHPGRHFTSLTEKKQSSSSSSRGVRHCLEMAFSLLRQILERNEELLVQGRTTERGETLDFVLVHLWE